MIKPPLFILFEGIDGSGKTTQARLLAEYLNKTDSALFLREPTDSDSGKKIRDILKNKKPQQDLLKQLFIQDREYDVLNNIIPAIQKQTTVVLDRYYYSNAAYQGTNSEDLMAIINENRSRQFPEPDIIFYIDIDPETALKRIDERNTKQCFEHRSELERIRNNYRLIGDRFTVLNGANDIEDIHKEIISHVRSFIRNDK